MSKSKVPAPRKPLIPPVGTYLVWGPDRAPELRLIDAATRAFLLGRTTDPNPYVRAGAAPAIFGRGFTEIVAAWDEAFLRTMGEHYEGVQQAGVRRTCAALVLGITFQELDRRSDNGGAGDRLQPLRPLPQPGGVAVALPVGAGQP